MELVFDAGSFASLSMGEMMSIDGGGYVGRALQATAGTILIAVSPVVAVAAGVVATPAGGAFAGMACLGFGLSLVGKATH